MSQKAYQEAANFISDNLRLRTQPIATKFLTDLTFPEKTIRPGKTLAKRITICQAVTLARVYGWTVGLAPEDLICVPAMITFGFTKASDQPKTVGKLFCNVTFSKDRETGDNEGQSMQFLVSGEFKGILLTPLLKAAEEPDTITIYGNPAQIMRLNQAWTYITGSRITGNFGGKVECSEYLIAPYKTKAPRVAIPGGGDRIFSMTQDDEMAFALPGSEINNLVDGLKMAGKKIGAKYPITFYQNFQPEFPKYYKELADELEIDK